MLIVGLTGGIATGKSLVTRLLAQHGAVTFSADEAARAVLTPGGPVLQEIAATFGPEMLTPGGSLDRARLGQRIFADAAAREQLNQITHPPILRLLSAQIAAVHADLPPDTVAVFEVPLLFEAKLQAWFERIVVVASSVTLQVQRLCERNGLDEPEARRRLAAQLPLTAKIAQADYVVNNDGSLPDLIAATEALWRQLTADNKPQD
jgi:dephospho-CoA kinase